MIEVESTLELMARIYRLSAVGGANSDRFTAYVAAGHSRAPVQGYNPMTSQPVLATIEALVLAGAEDRLCDVANRTAQRLGYEADDVMHFSIAATGMWTDRLATEVEHRFLGRDPGGVIWWYDDPLDLQILDSEMIAQTVRLVFQRAGGAPKTLLAAVQQEGTAGAQAGRPGRLHSAAAEVLEVLGGDPSLATMVAFFYGDKAASTMGFAPVGIGTGIGLEHSIGLAKLG